MATTTPLPPGSLSFDPCLNDLLIAEFTYIAQSTTQSSEDRARVSNYYLVTVGAAIAAIVSVKFDTTLPSVVYIALGIGFGVLALLGLFTVLSLIRLRAGWMAGASAMDTLKEYYIQTFNSVQFEHALEWTRKNLPAPNKLDSVAFWTACGAILIDSAMLAMAYLFLGIGLAAMPALDHSLIQNSLLIAAAYVVSQVAIYWWQLRPQIFAGKKPVQGELQTQEPKAA